jgi:microcystin-dependent protein
MSTPANDYFRVPDMRGRVPIGYWDALDSDAEPDGDYDNYPDAGGSDPDSTFYGEKSHELTEAEGPTHDHGAETSEDGDHKHDLNMNPSGGQLDSIGKGDGTSPDVGATGMATDGAHIHTIAASGDGDAHENRQLSTVMGYLVYTGVF